MKILTARAELFNADRQTDGRTVMTNIIFAFLNFLKAPKKYSGRLEMRQMTLSNFSQI
jgi:hypothetical protein